MLYGYSTKTLKEVLPNYDTFKLVYADSPFFTNENVWTGPSKQTFKLIYNYYAGSHLAMSEEDFINKLENILYEHYEEFEYDLNLKKTARSTTDLEWGAESDIIQNEAAAPNTEGATDSLTMASLDKQTKIKTQAGYSAILAKKFSNNKSYYIKSFLDNFKWLFIRILDPQTTEVWTSDTDGNFIEGE